MQTLERTQDLGSTPAPHKRSRRRPFALALGVVALVAVTALTVYGLTSSQTVTKTISVEAPKAPVTAARNCVPGAAPGSCNTDEFAEEQIPDKPLDGATRAVLAQQLVAARTA